MVSLMLPLDATGGGARVRESIERRGSSSTGVGVDADCLDPSVVADGHFVAFVLGSDKLRWGHMACRAAVARQQLAVEFASKQCVTLSR